MKKQKSGINIIYIMQSVSPKPLPHGIAVCMNQQNAVGRRSNFIDRFVMAKMQIFKVHKSTNCSGDSQRLVGICNKVIIQVFSKMNKNP